MVQLRTRFGLADFPLPCKLADDGFHFFINVELLEIMLSDRFERIHVCLDSKLPVLHQSSESANPLIPRLLTISLQSHDQAILKYELEDAVLVKFLGFSVFVRCVFNLLVKLNIRVRTGVDGFIHLSRSPLHFAHFHNMAYVDISVALLQVLDVTPCLLKGVLVLAVDILTVAGT